MELDATRDLIISYNDLFAYIRTHSLVQFVVVLLKQTSIVILNHQLVLRVIMIRQAIISIVFIALFIKINRSRSQPNNIWG